MKIQVRLFKMTDTGTRFTEFSIKLYGNKTTRAPGIYFLRIAAGDNVKTERVVISDR